MAAVVQDTLMFNFAAKKLPIDRKVLRWFRENHSFEFRIFVVGEGTGCLDQLLARRLSSEWVSQVYWVPTFDAVLEEMKYQPWVLGYLTKDKMLINPNKHVFEFTGPTMKLKKLPVFTEMEDAEKRDKA
jgi:hypothetical protein